jgi:hypothetical protein
MPIRQRIASFAAFGVLAVAFASFSGCARETKKTAKTVADPDANAGEATAALPAATVDPAALPSPVPDLGTVYADDPSVSTTGQNIGVTNPTTVTAVNPLASYTTLLGGPTGIGGLGGINGLNPTSLMGMTTPLGMQGMMPGVMPGMPGVSSMSGAGLIGLLGPLIHLGASGLGLKEETP